MSLLETFDLCKHFGGLAAVNRVSLRVEPGEVVGLIGPNGAGKTTFINAVAGLNPPTAGRVVFNGRDTGGWMPEKMCHAGLSRTFQIPRPFPKMTALENVLTAATFGLVQPPGEHRDLTALSLEALDFVHLNQSPDSVCETLNTVQMKRVDLARALVTRPKMLFLDELAAGLTDGELTDMIRLITRIRERGITILMVEHIMKLIMNVCDRLIVLNFGTKIAEGPTREVARDPAVLEAYFGAGHC
ncbi:ABC transporter ATP-binding protein [Deltaproteobacteria bacterium OttesenSCG-928-M10]|nr:ABC transporter ATP-binding protein [Deltaproteobacteria bacterium OttesenSCG-928-M10]